MISVYRTIGNGYSYGYNMAGTGKARWRRMTLMERFRLSLRRRHTDDLAGLRGWNA